MKIYRTIEETVEKLPVSFKVRLEDSDESIKVQEHLFKLGYKWGNDTKVRFPNCPMLYADDNKMLRHGDWNVYFDKCEYPLVTVRDILNAVPKKELNIEHLLSEFLIQHRCFTKFLQELSVSWNEFMKQEHVFTYPRQIIANAFPWGSESDFWMCLDSQWLIYLDETENNTSPPNYFEKEKYCIQLTAIIINPQFTESEEVNIPKLFKEFLLSEMCYVRFLNKLPGTWEDFITKDFITKDPSKIMLGAFRWSGEDFNLWCELNGKWKNLLKNKLNNE